MPKPERPHIVVLSLGRYAGASPDPNCAAQVWGTNELNGATNPGTATWASQNFRLQLDECPTAAFAITPTSPAHGSPVTFDGSGSSDIDGSVLELQVELRRRG